jgi:uncharacterized protein (TIGR03435 family)
MKSLCGAALLASILGLAQTPPRLEFEVASIKPSGPMTAGGKLNLGMHVDGAQVRCTSFSLKDYIRIAYKVKDYQIQAPDWTTSERFDISAKLPEGATREQVPEMMQALLAERFQVKLHREKKEFPVYALTMGKGGLKMKQSSLDADPEGGAPGKAPINVDVTGSREGTTVSMGKGAAFTMGNNRIEGKKLTMAQLAETLARFEDRPVVDMTDLQGNYDLTLEFSPEDFRAMMIRAAVVAGVSLPPEALKLLDGTSGDSLPTAIQTLGLKLEARKAPLEVLVIDRVVKTPIAN